MGFGSWKFILVFGVLSFYVLKRNYIRDFHCGEKTNCDFLLLVMAPHDLEKGG
jgi:hypothetical protein